MQRAGENEGPLGRLLAELAAAHGIDTRYRDSTGKWRESPAGSVVAVLRALGSPVAGLPPDFSRLSTRETGRAARVLAAALHSRRRQIAGRPLEPVLLAWEGVMPSLPLRLSAENGAGLANGGRRPAAGPRAGRVGGRGRAGGERETVRLTLTLEDASSLTHELPLRSLTAGQLSGDVSPSHLVPSGVWRRRLPLGYHRVRLEYGHLTAEALVVAAPRRCWSPPGSRSGPGSPREPAGAPWGVFAPLYALRSERDWGAGDLAELERLCRCVGAEGGTAVATLPLLAAFLDRPFEPAPYRPVSRLFWNEFYLPVEQLAEFAHCPQAAATWRSPELRARVAELRADPLVDYGELMRVKRGVVEELAQRFFVRGDSGRQEAFRSYLGSHPEAWAYAHFRAEVERRGTDWREWEAQPGEPGAAGTGRAGAGATPAPGGAGVIAPPDQAWGGWDPVVRYHLYCQWQMEERLAAIAAAGLAGAGGERGSGAAVPARLLLDLPIGVHPGGFDTWRWRDLFLPGVSTGAPPDAFFSLGQDWDFLPLHPDRAREAGYDYLASCLRQEMRYAGFLRVDHVMGLHRLYVIPAGRTATEGVYLNYPAEEQYAVLALESHRARTAVVGEDLGTVPPGVRASMARHGVLRTWVLQTSLRPQAAVPVAAVPARALTSINTHDMSPFAGFLLGEDIQARVETGQLAEEDAPRQMEARRRLVRRLARFLLGERSTEGTAAAAPPPGLGPGVGESGQAASLPAALLPAALRHLAGSGTSLVLVNLEDLLFETEPQNRPGTGPERHNWRRKLRVPAEQVEEAVRTAARWLRP